LLVEVQFLGQTVHLLGERIGYFVEVCLVLVGEHAHGKVIHRHERLPGRWVLFLLVIVGCSGILIEFRSLFGRDAGVAMLVVFMAMKLLELKSQRDAVVVVVLGYFLLLTHYFYSQSIPTGLWLLFALWLVTATLIRLHGGPASTTRASLRYAASLCLQAIPFMLVLYLLFPRISGPLWGLPSDAHAGKAGTGKTLLALAASLAQMNEYKQILLARPIVALSNKDIGFLPGDAKEKVAPYMQPLFDNLNVIKRQFAATSTEVKRLEEMQKSEQLVIEALAFIRGRSLSETFCIVDEAQNLTPHEIKTIITRAGEGTKMVFTGDIQQIDQPYLDSESNGLVYMIDRMKDQNLFAHINLMKGERSMLSELASILM
jgi:hypothetical protein